MGHSSEDSPRHKQGEILFQSEYGGYPKYALNTFLPFLLLLAVGLLVHVIWFNGGIAINRIKVPPIVVALGICPMIFLLCAFVIGSEIYRRFHPQRIVITADKLILPKGRFTNDEIHIRWHNLSATLKSSGIAVMDVYDITCFDSSQETTTSISSPLFRHFDEFATFALIIGEVMGVDWSIKGFLPGKFRGNQKQARRASKRIQSRENF